MRKTELDVGKSHAAVVSTKVSHNATRTVHWGGSAGLKLQTNKYERYAVGHKCDGACASSKQSQIPERAKFQRLLVSRALDS